MDFYETLQVDGVWEQEEGIIFWDYRGHSDHRIIKLRNPSSAKIVPDITHTLVPVRRPVSAAR